MTDKERFIELMTKAGSKRKGFRELMEFLEESGFYESPASRKYHGAFRGGLLKHSLNVYDRMEARMIEYIRMGGKEESAIIAALLHDVCKVGLYMLNDSNEYEYNNDIALPVGHGERSVIMIQQMGFILRCEEICAIRWHMGMYDEAARGGSREIEKACRMYPLATMIHMADMEASRFDERDRKEQNRHDQFFL